MQCSQEPLGRCCRGTDQRSTARDGASRGKKECHSSITHIHIPLAMLVIGARPHDALHVLRAQQRCAASVLLVHSKSEDCVKGTVLLVLRTQSRLCQRHSPSCVKDAVLVLLTRLSTCA